MFANHVKGSASCVRAEYLRIFQPFAMLSPDTKHIFVNVGFGFHAELTLDEALEFIKKKEVHLQKYER